MTVIWRAAKYFAESKSDSTRRVYARAWAEFAEYCAWRRQRALPAPRCRNQARRLTATRHHVHLHRTNPAAA